MLTEDDIEELKRQLAVPGPLPRQVDILDPAQRSSYEVERWKSEAEEAERQRIIAREQRKAREREIIAEQARVWAEAQAAAEPGFNELQIEIIGALISELRKEFRGEARKDTPASDLVTK